MVMNRKGFFFSFMAVILVTSVFLLTAGSASSVLSEDFDVRVSDESFGSSVDLIDSLEDSVFEDSLSVASYHALNELSCYIDDNGFFSSRSEFDSLLSSLIWRGSFNPISEPLLVRPGAINSAQALFDIRDDLNGDYFLTGNIDLSGFDNDNNNGNGNWLPIGSSSAPFTGSFNGNGFSITGLNVSSSSTHAGLFGKTSGANISNVSVAGSVTSTTHRVGGLIGTADNSNISYVSFSGNVSGNWHVGGLIGRSSEGLNVSFSSSSGMVNGTGGNIGGLVGYVRNGSVVSFSSSSSSVNSSAPSDDHPVGGLVGSLDISSEVVVSFASGNVSGPSEIGGLVGRLNADSNISDSFASGTVSGLNNLGGLAGTLRSRSHIYDSFSFGAVVGSASGVGGFVGRNDQSTSCSTDSYWDTDTSGISDRSGCNSGGSGRTTSALKMPTGPTGIYRSWDPNIWDFGTSSEYPSLILPSLESPSVSTYSASGSPFGGGSGTVDEPFIVVTGKHLNNVKTNLGAHYVLVEDVDLLSDGFSNWLPIGNSSNPFTGSFNGNGFVIHNLVSSVSSASGLFGSVNNADISNVGVNNGKVVGIDNVGGLVSSSVNSRFSNVHFSGSVTGKDHIGGLIGTADNSNVSSSFSKGVVRGNSSIGGLVGEASGGSFNNSYSVSSVFGNSSVGGFIGSPSGNPSVSFSYFYGNVSSPDLVDVGFLGSGSVSCSNSNVFHNISSSSSKRNSDCGESVSENDLKKPFTCGGEGGVNSSLLNPSGSGANFASWDDDLWYFGDNDSLPVLRDTGREVGYSLGRSLFYFSDLIRQNSGHSLTFHLNESVVSVSQESPWTVKVSYPVDFSLRFNDYFWRRDVSVNSEFSIEGIFDPLFVGLKSIDKSDVIDRSDVTSSLFVPVVRGVSISSLSSSPPDASAILSRFINNSEYFDPGSRAPSFLDRFFGNLNISSARFCSDSNGCGVEMILNPSPSGGFDFSTMFSSGSFPSTKDESYVGWCFFSNLCSSGAGSPSFNVDGVGNIRLDQDFHRGIYKP